MTKRIEVIIPGPEIFDFETLREIARKNFTVWIEFPPPVPITTRKTEFGARVEGVEEIVGYDPGGSPKIFLEIGREEEDRILFTARTLLDYYETAGPAKFRSAFGVKGISIGDLLETCRDIVKEKR